MSAIDRFVQWVLHLLRRWLGIRSPSLELAEAGRFISTGFDDGLDDALQGRPSRLTPEQQARAWDAIVMAGRSLLFFDDTDDDDETE